MSDKYYRNKIKYLFSTDLDMDKYKNILEEYKVFLEKRILNRPTVIANYIKLSSIYFELGYNENHFIKLLENALKYSENKDDTGDVYNNLAFFYEEISDYYDNNKNLDIQKAMNFLEKALNNNYLNPKTINALGAMYYKNNREKESVELFKIAYSLDKKLEYLYNYGVSLYSQNEIEKAINIFEKLDEENMQNNHNLDIYLNYALAVSYAINKENEKSVSILKNLLKVLTIEDELTEVHIENVFFYLGEYEEYINIYNNTEYDYGYFSPWLEFHFYSLKLLGQMDNLEKFYNNIIKEEEYNLLEMEKNPLEILDTVEEWPEFYNMEIERINDIKDSYSKIISTDYKPEPTIYLELMEECYLKYCLRHE